MIEYKTDVKESPIDDILRQIKGRIEIVEEKNIGRLKDGFQEEAISGEEIEDYKSAHKVLVSFDRRFNNLEAILENEDIHLVTYSSESSERLIEDLNLENRGFYFETTIDMNDNEGE